MDLILSDFFHLIAFARIPWSLLQGASFIWSLEVEIF